jgi:aminopeptidase-like protein
MVLSCLGDPGSFTYKKSRQGNATIDQAFQNVLRSAGTEHTVIDFWPYGYDERNYCSPKFNLPVGSITRSTHSEFTGYHSSGDNMDLVSPERLAESLMTCLATVAILENNAVFLNLIPEAEPQLGKRGLYGMMGGLLHREPMEMAFLWVMNFSDGEHSLLDISDRSGFRFEVLREAAAILCNHGILKEAPPAPED